MPYFSSASGVYFAFIFAKLLLIMSGRRGEKAVEVFGRDSCKLLW
jgi:hypothetical protein